MANANGMSGAEFLSRTSRTDFRADGFRPVGNEACAAATRETARSNAAQRHTSKKFKGTRTNSKRKAISNGGW